MTNSDTKDEIRDTSEEGLIPDAYRLVNHEADGLHGPRVDRKRAYLVAKGRTTGTDPTKGTPQALAGKSPHPAGHHEPSGPGELQRLQRLGHQHFDDGGLGAGRQIGQGLAAGRSAQLAMLGEYGRLQSGQRKVQGTACLL